MHVIEKPAIIDLSQVCDRSGVETFYSPATPSEFSPCLRIVSRDIRTHSVLKLWEGLQSHRTIAQPASAFVIFVLSKPSSPEQRATAVFQVSHRSTSRPQSQTSTPPRRTWFPDRSNSMTSTAMSFRAICLEHGRISVGRLTSTACYQT